MAAVTKDDCRGCSMVWKQVLETMKTRNLECFIVACSQKLASGGVRYQTTFFKIFVHGAIDLKHFLIRWCKAQKPLLSTPHRNGVERIIEIEESKKVSKENGPCMLSRVMLFLFHFGTFRNKTEFTPFCALRSGCRIYLH